MEEVEDPNLDYELTHVCKPMIKVSDVLFSSVKVTLIWKENIWTVYTSMSKS